MARTGTGWGSGLLGVIIFSGSLPATRAAVDGFSPLFLTSARAVIAALVGAALLALVTALCGVLRGGERPRPPFWLFSALGSATVAGFALLQGGGGMVAGDLLMVAAILWCGLGYAEGAALARRLGGWQVISWALLLALPLTMALALLTLPAVWRPIETGAWLGLGYVSLFSMMLGFVFWYRGLALGGVAGVAQLQLLQPLLGLLLAGLLLREPVAWSMIAATGLVVACVAGARRFA